MASYARTTGPCDPASGLALTTGDGDDVEGPRSALDAAVASIAAKRLILLSDAERTVVTHYLVAAAYTAGDEEDEQGRSQTFDKVHRRWSDEAITEAISDCTTFVREQREHVAGLAPDLVGHNMWLSRSGSGTGFIDRDELGWRGHTLHDAAHRLRERTPYLGDDGLTYLG